MLDISPILLGVTLVVFLILIAVLNSWLYRPLLSYMSKRDADLKRDLHQVGSNDDEVSALIAKSEQTVMDAKLEAAALREKVIADAKELAQSKLDAKRAELAGEYLEFEKTLAQERKELNNALLSQAPLFKEAIKAKFSQL
ncbi:MAG: FoF1 ATP synthase subunit B' [Thiovulaceae bacterium]|nr:FoF1 ATP synthase subunit B' [Sulfurimonadaceae bacterium]